LRVANRSSRSLAPRRRRQNRSDQGFHLIPNGRVTFNLDVRFHEDLVVPRIPSAFEGACFVVKSEVPEYPSACCIGGANVVVSAKKSLRLIKVGGLRHVGGDSCVIAAAPGDTIHLQGEEHGDAIFFERTRQIDRFRGAPAMPVNDDSGILLLFHSQRSIMVCVQKSQDFPLGNFPMTVFKSLNIHSGGILLAQTRCELNLAVDRIIVRDEPAEEPDDDGWRFSGILVRGNRGQRNILARGENGRKEANTNAS